MKTVFGIENYISDRSTAVTVGKFDGLHRGHLFLIETLREKKSQSDEIVAVTFDIPPQKLIEGVDITEKKQLFTMDERAEIIKSAGADVLLVLSFDEDLMKMEPDAFIGMLHEKLNMRLFAAGVDFRFGYKGRGDAALLAELSQKMGVELYVEDKIREDEADISSSRIREALAAGKLDEANRLLGRPYLITGEVVHGAHKGTGIGFPTINIVPPSYKLLPPYGVYVSVVTIDGHIYHGITDIGVKPTVTDRNETVVETHILDFSSSIYGKTAKIELLKHLREEKKFDSLDDLKHQLMDDKKRAIEHFRS